MARVGVDAHVLDGKRQGSRTWLANTLAALAQNPGRHRWVIYSAEPELTRALYRTDAFEHRPMRRQGPLGRQLWFLPQAARRDALDGLVVQYSGPPFVRIPTFVVIHDLLFESNPELFPAFMRWRLRILCRMTARRAAAVFTVSQHVADEIRRTYGVAPERIRLAPNGVSQPLTPSPSDDARAVALRPFVLCVGRLEPRKNVGLALQASAAARSAGARLVVVGQADFGSASLARALAVEPNVVHITDASDSLLASLYRRAAALVYPSLGEGFGIPIIDALAHGTPVLASNRPAIPEIGGTLATYFDPRAPTAAQDLGAMIERVLAESPRLDGKAVAAHLARFDWSIGAAALVRAADAL